MAYSWDTSRTAFAAAARWFTETAGQVGDRWDLPGLGEWDVRALVGHTSRSFITPYVGVLPRKPELEPNEAEVEKILHVRLRELLDPSIFREERWGLAPLDRPIYFFEIVGDTIWGATAFMLRNLLALLTGTEWRSQRARRS